MMLDERSSILLAYIVNSDSYLPIDQLTEKLNVSRRTIYYDVEKINSWLKQNGLNAVKHIRSMGFYLDDETKDSIPDRIKRIKKWNYEYSAKERKAWLAVNIITSSQKLFLNDLIDIIRVSRNTTISDLKELKEEIKKFDITISYQRQKGYIAEGSEHDKRRTLIFYLSHVISKQGWEYLISQIQMFLNSSERIENDYSLNLFEKEKIQLIYDTISNCEKKLGTQFTDEVLHSLSLHLLLFIKRFTQGKQIKIDPVEKQVLKSTKEYLAAKYISQTLEKIFHISFPEDEVCYITTHILSSKVNYLDVNYSGSEDESILRNIICNMVNDFQRYACVNFQERELLEQDLITHLKPAYYRIKYGLDVDNPLGESIKEKYKELFILTKKVVHHLEDSVNKKVSDDEIAFIAAHFGGWMRKEGVVPVTRKKALIVCASGVGTSRILKNQLEGLFSTVDIVNTVSLREYENNQYDVDLIISTVPISKKDKDVLLVSPILTDTEKEKLLKKVNYLTGRNDIQSNSVEAILDIISNYATIHDKQGLYQELKQYIYKPTIAIKEDIRPMLNELITKERIQLVDKVESWEEAIRLASKPLLDAECISNEYIQAMINNVKELGPYIVIAPKVAIPHARPNQGVKKVGMSLLRLKEKIGFSNEEDHNANLIIVLAAIDNESHLRALAQLSTLLSEDNNIEKLIESNSVEEILSLLNKYSN